jgi:hypothetical protein
MLDTPAGKMIRANLEYFETIVKRLDEAEALGKTEDPAYQLKTDHHRLRNKAREGRQVIADYEAYELPESIALQRVEAIFKEAKQIAQEATQGSTK